MIFKYTGYQYGNLCIFFLEINSKFYHFNNVKNPYKSVLFQKYVNIHFVEEYKNTVFLAYKI